jgi:hypothetical protein
VSPEVTLELIQGDSLDIGVSVAVSLPPIHYGSKLLVRCEHDLLTVGALGYLLFLLNQF